MDVLICGGGVSGVMAAISSARAGNKTTVLEMGGCLGGMWTAGLLGYTLDADNKEGLLKEFLELLKYETDNYDVPIYEAQKYLLEKICVDAGVRILYHTHVYACETENRKITKVKAVSKSGVMDFYPHAVIDATGDGDIAVLAGCGYDIGRPEDGKCQPMSMIAVISGVTEEGIGPYIAYHDQPFWDARKRFLNLLSTCGVVPSLGCASIMKLNQSLFYLIVNQEYDKLGINADDLSEAVISARREVYDIVKKLRTSGCEGFKNITLAVTPEMMGVREGRRIHGRYTVCLADMIAGRRHEDSVCKVTYWVDIHSVEKGGEGFSDEGIVSKPYDIPLRALQPLDCDNLLLAGRCISGDFYAHASYRVAGNMAAVGEAAGTNISKICSTHTI